MRVCYYNKDNVGVCLKEVDISSAPLFGEGVCIEQDCDKGVCMVSYVVESRRFMHWFGKDNMIQIALSKQERIDK